MKLLGNSDETTPPEDEARRILEGFEEQQGKTLSDVAAKDADLAERIEELAHKANTSWDSGDMGAEAWDVYQVEGEIRPLVRMEDRDGQKALDVLLKVLETVNVRHEVVEGADWLRDGDTMVRIIRE